MARPSKKRAARKQPVAAARAAAPAATLRRLSGTFAERRFEAEVSRSQVASVLAMSLGGVALGAGIYGVALRGEELAPISYAPFLLAAGVVLLGVWLLLGQKVPPPVRVGELGVGFEKDGKVTRTAWHELTAVRFEHDSLCLRTTGAPLTLPLSVQGPAARRVLAEVLRRMPKTVEIDEDDQARIGAPHADEGEPLEVEPPQVAGLTCLASDRPLTFERDVRLCARCAAHYDKTSVPSRCVRCNKRLKT